MAASATIANLVAKITGDDKDFQRSMTRVENRLKKLSGLSGQQGPLGRLGRISQAFKSAPIVAGLDRIRVGLQVVSEAAMRFEREFKVVQAITTGSQADFQKLERQIVALSSATEMSSSQFISAAAVFGRAGFAAKEVGVALETVADLATASGVSTEMAANMAVRMLKAYGLETSRLADISDVLAQAAANANVTIRGLAEGFKFTGAIAQQQGIAFNEVVTALSLLGETGLEAGLAGRALQAMIMDLAKPTDQAVRELTRLGVTTHQASGEALPLSIILRQLRDSGMSSAQAFTIFNRNSARAVTALTRNVDAFDEFLEKLQASESALKTQADTMREGLSVELDKLSNKFDALLKNIGDGINPQLEKMAENLNSILDGLVKLTSSSGFKNFMLLAAKIATPLALTSPQDVSDLFPTFSHNRPGPAAAPETFAQGMAAFGVNQNFSAAGAGADTKKLLGDLLGISFEGSQEKSPVLEEAEKSAENVRQVLMDVGTILAEGTKTIQDRFDLAELTGTLENFDLAQATRVAFSKIFTKLKNDPTLVNSQQEAFKNTKEAINQYMEGAALSIQRTLDALAQAAEDRARRADLFAAAGARGAKMGATQFARFGGTVTAHQDFGLGQGGNAALSQVSRNLGRPGSTMQVGGTFQNDQIAAILESELVHAATTVFQGLGEVVLDNISGFSPEELQAAAGMIDGLLNSMGDFGSAVNTFASTLTSTGNPLMAVAATLGEIITGTEGFEATTHAFNQIIVELQKLLEPFMEGLFLISSVFMNILKVLNKILVPVFNFIGAIFTRVGQAIASIANIFVLILNGLIKIANLFGADFDYMPLFDVTTMYEDTLRELNDETDKTKEGLKKLNEELINSANVAAGFKLNLRAFQAALGAPVNTVSSRTRLNLHAGGVVPGVGEGDAIPAMLTPGETVVPRGGASGGVVIQSLHVHVADTKDFMRKLTREEEFQNLVRTGSPIKGKLAGIR